MKDENLYCSFCGKSNHEVSDLIAGPTVFICDECVDLCAEIVSAERGLPESPTPADRKWAWDRAQEITLAHPNEGPRGDGWVQMTADRILAWTFPQTAPEAESTDTPA